MKVVSTEALTKLIQLVKSAFIKVDDVAEVSEIGTETPNEVELATVATTGDYDDLINKPNSLINTATGVGSLTIYGASASQRQAINIGYLSVAYEDGVALGDGAYTGKDGVSIGYGSECNGYGVALGYNAQSLSLGSIQIGRGTNSQSMTMAVGFFNGTNSYEYQLLDGTTGLIPDARMSSNIARTSNIPSATSELNNDSGFITSSAIDTMLATLYPVGSIYIGTQTSCPLATLISDSTWVKVSEGRVLQGADSSHSANSTIAAGLPNITGETYSTNSSASSHYANTYNGVFRGRNTGGTSYYSGNNVSSSDTNVGISFNASRSNSIYGASSTVQPPAYCVNIWRRTA